MLSRKNILNSFLFEYILVVQITLSNSELVSFLKTIEIN